MLERVSFQSLGIYLTVFYSEHQKSEKQDNQLRDFDFIFVSEIPGDCICSRIYRIICRASRDIAWCLFN